MRAGGHSNDSLLYLQSLVESRIAPPKTQEAWNEGIRPTMKIASTKNHGGPYGNREAKSPQAEPYRRIQAGSDRSLPVRSVSLGHGGED